MNQNDIKRSPIDFLYCWADDTFQQKVSTYLGSSFAAAIRNKRNRQLKVARNAFNAGSDNSKVPWDTIAGWIRDEYGYAPTEILVMLLQGKSVAGKNWKAGVFGVGGAKLTVFKGSSDYAVDTATGKLYETASGDDNIISGGSPIYANDANGNSYISGYSYNINGNSYTTLRGADGKYYASTYGTSAGMFQANGSAYTGANASSVWENIQTSIPYINQFLQWVASIYKISVMQPEKTVPSQSEFMVYYPKQDNTLSYFAIGGAVVLGSMLLLRGGRRKKTR